MGELPGTSSAAPAGTAVAGAGREDILATSAAGPAAARGGGLRVGGYLVGVLVGALAAALLFRHLGKTNVGLYTLAVSLVAIVGAFSDLGLTAIGVREISTLPPEEGWSLARDLLGLRITLTVVGVAVVTAIAWVAYSGTLAAGVALAGTGLLVQAVQDNFSIPLTVGLRLGWMAALDLSRQLLTTLLTVVLVLLGAGLVPFLGISIPVGLVVLPVTVVLVRGVRTLAPTFAWRRWRRLVGAMLPFAVAVAASALYLRVALLLVSALSDRTQLDYFGVSFRIVEVLTLVPGLLVSSAFPIFARAAGSDHDRLGYGLGKVFDVSLILGAWVAVSIAVGAPLAMAVIGGPEFKDAAPVLAVQGVTLGAMFVSLVWANGLLSMGLYRQIMVLNVSALIGNALLVALLIPIDGAQGAAIGTAIAEIAVGIAQALTVIHGRPQLKPSLRVVPPVALAAALGLLPLALVGLPDIVRLCISTALFGVCMIATRAIPREALELIPWGGVLGRGRGNRP
jgi:O-antigen/teichoic acid export membrane protein